jgi:hypothetical protein
MAPLATDPPCLDSTLRYSDQRRIAMLVSSVPLSETMLRGRPRAEISASSSWTTRRPEIDVSGTGRSEIRKASDTILAAALVLGAPALAQEEADRVARGEYLALGPAGPEANMTRALSGHRRIS